MGSALRSVLEKVGLREPEVDEYEEYGEEETEGYGEVHEFPHSTEVAQPNQPGTAANPQAPQPVVSRIKTSKPTSYSDAPEIGDYLRDNVPVILNLTYMGQKEAQRMIDFVSGLCYGLGGQLDPVSDRVLLLTPQNVKTVDDQAKRPVPFLPSAH